MFVVSWLVAAVAVMPEQALGYVIAALIFAAPFVALFVVGRRRYRRFAAAAEAARERERTVVIHCPTCGGQSELAPEAPVLPCRYCAGALAADETALRELIAVARDSAERERRVAVHQGWRLAAHRNRDPRTDLVPFFVIGGIGSLWVIGSLLAGFTALGFRCEADEGGLVASLGIAELDALIADPQGLESIGAALVQSSAS